MKNREKKPLVSRRGFLGALPAVSVAAVSHAAPQDAHPVELDKDSLDAAQKIFGLEPGGSISSESCGIAPATALSVA